MTRPPRTLPLGPSPAPDQVDAGVLRIAVDLLGGEGAPAVVVDGVLRACSADSDLHLLLVGPRAEADEVTGALCAGDRARVTSLVVEGVVGMADPPVLALRHDTTVRAAAEAVVDGRASAMVSAGASGAAITAAVHGIGRLPGVPRPALAATVPSLVGPVVLLDVGAGREATVLDLRWHAILGAAYATLVEGVLEPRVGLLSIGAESGKGDRLRRSAEPCLARLALPSNARYVGLVEGNDVPMGGPADVVVTDGFTGNVLLKGIEGAYALALGGKTAPIGVPRAAALLGVEGTVVMCHGSATADDIADGIALAARLHRLQLSARLAAVAREVPVEAQ